ncbi:helix-turn-helix transcriptional regulator [Burkholderia sp. Ap-962]|uniref:helix-turn-helix domain-containing protein n=1 Tax=Burkholderia sp. Ap-962 TaxID=2608333 RepID=UPI001420D22A|nr:helix-turn-helix transcriptional regulator [Burkholderia sp. Ap-962]NIF72976.1 helix-turn-helix transcriptional regulator [Burkholderia sp. Ap-962]
MRYARKSPEALRELRSTLPERLARERPDIASAARWIREAIGLNQEEFAELVGLSKPLVARLERGEANPTLDTLNAIGKPFGLRIAFVPRQEPAHGADTFTGSTQEVAPAPEPVTQAPRPRRKLPPLVFDKITK